MSPKYLVLFLIVSCAAQMTKEEHDKIAETAAAECAESTKANLVAIGKTTKGNFDDPTLPDFFLCMFKKLGFMDDDGKYKPDVMKTNFLMESNAEETTKILEDCAKETTEAAPQAALSLAKCLLKHDKERTSK